MRRDLLITFANNALSFICRVSVYRLAARWFGPVGFGEYALARRGASFLQPVLLMGLGVGLTRYIAISPAKADNGTKQASYIVAGYGSVLLFSLLVIACAGLMPGVLGKAVFGKPGYEGYVLAIAFLGESYLVCSLVFAYFRGNGRFVEANIFSTLSDGIVPIAALLCISSVKTALEGTAAGAFLVALVFSLPVVRAVVPCLKNIEWTSSLKELLRYGLARVPGDISMAGFRALPVFLVSNLFGVTEAGYVAVGISMVDMVGEVFAPIGLITLPKMS